MSESQDSDEDGGLYAICRNCDWYATPDDHEYADVLTAAEVHATFEGGHTATAGASGDVVNEARSRARSGGGEADGD